MYAVLEEIGNLETTPCNTVDERKLYKDKSAEIRKKITSIMKHASELKSELLEDLEKLNNVSSSADRSKVCLRGNHVTFYAYAHIVPTCFINAHDKGIILMKTHFS